MFVIGRSKFYEFFTFFMRNSWYSVISEILNGKNRIWIYQEKYDNNTDNKTLQESIQELTGGNPPYRNHTGTDNFIIYSASRFSASDGDYKLKKNDENIFHIF
jgi:hypothetical protein